MSSSTRIPAGPDPGPSGDPRWPTALAAASSVVAGALAVYSPSWAVGVGTAAGLFAVLAPMMRR
ncbi:hypothetical protein [Actinoplanes sp. NPDC026670]|uniref:hypothetical protein n=1 Tax=Actinoplanes sp. NPDC026670 TaxID=3154700 RepID=UPI0033CAD081